MGNVIIYDSLNYRSDVDHLLTRYQILENRLIDIGIGFIGMKTVSLITYAFLRKCFPK